MRSRHFSQQDQEILENPGSWQLQGQAFSSGQQPLQRVLSERRAWSEAHHHRHPYREFLIALDGRCVYAAGRNFYTCTPGTILYFDALEPHDEGYPPDAGDLRHLWVNVAEHGCFFSIINVRHGIRRSLRPDHHHMSIVDMGISSLTALLGKTVWAEPHIPDQRLRIQALLQIIVAEILRRESHPASQTSKENFHREAMRIVQRHLETTAGKGVTLDGLARLAGYSKYHFLRLFKQHAGCSVHDYINRCRLRYVQERRDRNHLQKEISHDLGFSCPAAFSRWLRQMKKQTG